MATVRQPYGAFGYSDNGRLQVYRWLAFALFSSESRSSVETLILRRERLGPVDATAFQEMATSRDALSTLWDAVRAERDAVAALAPTEAPISSTRRNMVIQPGSLFRVVNERDAIIDCVCGDQDLVGSVVTDDSNNGTAVVFVAGYGFCHVRQSFYHRATKRARMEPAPSSLALCDHKQAKSTLKSVVISDNARFPTEREGLRVFVQAIGSQLEGLRVETDVDEPTLRFIFQCCPNLESLALENAMPTTMDVVTAAYANGSRLSSLEIQLTNIPEPVLLDFLRQLQVDSPMARVLERLRLGTRWQCTAVVFHELKVVLRQNKTLTHVEVELRLFHGQRIKGRKSQHQFYAFAHAITTRGTRECIICRDAARDAVNLAIRSRSTVPHCGVEPTLFLICNSLPNTQPIIISSGTGTGHTSPLDDIEARQQRSR